jgi:predicted nucleic-acid-binding protein
MDTNVVVRFLTEDDPVQSPLAIKLFTDCEISLVSTVWAETEWVLRSVFKWQRARINQALSALLYLDNVSTPEQHRVHWALARHAEGADLADMLHVQLSSYADKFVTFDRELVHHAARLTELPVELLE